MTLSTRYSVRIADLYFDEQLPELKADIARYVQWSKPQPSSQAKWTSFSTIVIDLGKDPAALLSKMSANTRYEIRRSEKEGLVHRISAHPSSGALQDFCAAYDNFAALAQLPPVNRSRLKILAAGSSLYLSQMQDNGGQVLVWHAYWHAGGRARLLHSAALQKATLDPARRALIGRANRFQLWGDMLAFRAAGFTTFDLGGWYPGAADSKRLAINWFKEGFGGEIVENFNGLRPLSFKGRMAIWMNDRFGHGMA